MNKYFLLISLLFCFLGQAQSYTGKVEPVSNDGLCLIQLNTKVRSAIQNNKGSFRVFDRKKKEIPFVYFEPKNEWKQKKLNLSVLKKEVNDSVSTWIIDNAKKQFLNQLVLEIANTSIQKQYSISGSNDGKNWFGLTEKQWLYLVENESKNPIEQLVSFPITNYSYIKIEISDKNTLPINLLNVGFLKSKLDFVNPIEVKGFKVSKTENKVIKKSIYILSFEEPQHISKIEFAIADIYFQRNVRIYSIKTAKKKRMQQEDIVNFTLRSGSVSSIEFSEIFEKVIYIEIENLDNQPLDIKEIKLFQNPLYVIADLKANTDYEVIVDETIVEPQYDLGNFIPENTEQLKILQIFDFQKEVLDDNNKTIKFWQTKWFLWTCLILGGLLVAYFAFSLLKDLKTNG